MTKHAGLSHQLSPERWKALEPIVDAAVAATPAERQRLIQEGSGGDALVRAELEWMVAECVRDDPSLDRPAIERFASLFDDASLAAPEPPPIVAERFRLERELGRGGMATVYLAHDLKHAREVALKMVRPELAAILGGERFLQEIQVTATLRHPHILPLFDSGEADGCVYFVMPYVEGGTLRDRLAGRGPLPRADVVRIASQVAEGLGSAHAQGIVHRDVKPENILLAANGRHAYVSDFGISLAMSQAKRDASSSGSWLRLGTPAYMSPEQLDGSADLDERTDIYSLGCVIREMVYGAPPRRQPAGETSRPRSAPARWRRLRNRLRREPLEAIIERAIAPSLADRFQSAQELVRELATAQEALDSDRVKRRWRRVAVAAGVVAIAAGAASLSPIRDRIRAWTGNGVDPDLMVVLPFRGDSTGLAVLSGGNTARLLYDALGRWKDLKLGDEMAAVDAGSRNGAPPSTIGEARAVARSLGAGRFIWGEVNDARGVTRISAQLYDDRSPGKLISHFAYVSAGDGAAAKIEEIADSLVAKLIGTPAAGAGTSGTHTFAALKRYADGYAALHEWNTDLAEQDFRGAVDLDPRFPQAWLGLAQSMAWSARHRAADWLEPSTRALADSNALAPRDRLLALGLFALAQQRMPDACRVYRNLIARDARDFAAHYGLGDCLSMDRLIVADRNSPTRWQFRGSLHTAIQEYLRALALVPSYLEGSRGQTFARLTDRILFNDPGDYRRGFALDPDTVWMGAYPEISNDTLSFYPLPRAALATQPERPTNREALGRNRELLRTLMARWVAAFPRSATAWEHSAAALESAGALDSAAATGRNLGALGAIRLARKFSAAGDASALREQATHARILLKLSRLDEARAVADTALASRRVPTPAEASTLAPLAALTGRARLTARLLENAASDSANDLFSDRLGGRRVLPLLVRSAAGSFAGFAAFGAPSVSLRVTRDRLNRAIQIGVGPDSRAAVRVAVFVPSVLQAQPALGASMIAGLGESRQRLVPLWQALSRGDAAFVRRAVDREASRQSSSDATPAPDVSLQFALIALAVYDTSAATLVLDRVIAAVPELSARLTTETFPAAAFPRVLLLRARLTPRGAQRSALLASAKTLWLHADPELRAAADSISGGPQGERSTTGRTPRPPQPQH